MPGSGHRDPLAHRGGGGGPKGVRQPRPRLVAGPRPHRDGERGGGRPAGEVLEVQPEVEQEQLPALDHAVVLVVPFRAGAEAGVHQPHDARAAVACLDQPLEGQALAALDALEHHPAGRFPGGDAARHLHLGARTERHNGRASLPLLDRVGHVPRRDPGAGGDGPPHLLRGAGYLDLGLERAAIVVHGPGSSCGGGRCDGAFGP